jgi:hypothetical protein
MHVKGAISSAYADYQYIRTLAVLVVEDNVVSNYIEPYLPMKTFHLMVPFHNSHR